MTTRNKTHIVPARWNIKRFSISGLLVLGLIFSASAHLPQGADPNSEIAKWFKSLRNSQGLPCCDISDCRRVDARMANGHYEARIDEQWATVPDETIKDIENPTGQYIACYRYLESSRDFPPNFLLFYSDINGVISGQRRTAGRQPGDPPFTALSGRQVLRGVSDHIRC
jgi:hypothetical protein